MHPQEMAIVKSLVCVAWADGVFEEREKQMFAALLEAFRASPDQAKELETYAAQKRSLDDIDLDELTDADCTLLLQHAVLLSFIDGTQSDTEKVLIEELAKRLPLPADTAKDLISVAEGRAKKFLNLL